MKLCLTSPEREIPVTQTPYFAWDNPGAGDCSRASFTLDKVLTLAEGETITGPVVLKSDDDMVLNEINADNFLRYELSEYDGKSYLTFTNDPIPEPVEPPPPPTEKELIAMEVPNRRTAILTTRDKMVDAGFTATTEYGEEHFTLSDKDKTLLLGIYSMVQAGATVFPYHSVNTDNTTNICTIYSDADIGTIATTAFGFITYHESYANLLIQWLDRATTLAEIQTIEYGANLPTDLQEYLEMVLTAAGVPVPATPPVVPKDPVVEYVPEVPVEPEVTPEPTPKEPATDTPTV